MLDLGKECIVQCSLPNVRARAAKSEGGASRVRARLHDVVSNSSARFVIFLLASPRPPARPTGPPSEVLSLLRLHHASFALPQRPSVRPPSARASEVGRTTDRPTDGSGGRRRRVLRPSVRPRPLSCCVASFSSSFRLPTSLLMRSSVRSFPAERLRTIGREIL